MESSGKSLAAVQSLGSALALSLGVALVFTVAASVFDQFHQVAAEELNAREASAMVVGNAMQRVDIKDWGVQLSLPLGTGSSLLEYAVEGSDSIGLSTAALEHYGSKCSAGQNAAGALVRLATGSAGAKLAERQGILKGSFGGYDYVYETPASACAGVDQAADMAVQEVMIIEGYGTLSSE
ncbi:MAG TPA: hypothetical protein VGH44_02280 [Candidatus Saccharimonadia bacterium]|jgi:hypothetical protein